MVAVWIAAIQADFTVADVIALLADAELVFDIENGLSQTLGILARTAQEVKDDTLSRFLADAGEALTFLNQTREGCREFSHERG
jgi:hypothetical protein